MAHSKEGSVVRGNNRDLATYLAELKQQGSSLLITGDVTPSARAYVSRQFMGETGVYPVRRRILLSAGVEKSDIEQYLPPSVTSAERQVRIVHADSSARSAAVTTDTPIGTGAGLEQLRDEVTDVLSDLRSQYDHDGAGILRLGITSLLPLLHQTSEPAVAEFCQLLSAEIQASRGIAHYHLPVPSDDPLVDTFTPTVDAQIELRDRDGIVDHRWDVLDDAFDDKTDWMTL